MAVSVLQAQELLRQRQNEGPAGPVPIVIDARTRFEYEQGHIPGAAWLGWEEWCALPPGHLDLVIGEPGFWGLLQDPHALGFAGRLAQAGVSLARPIVVYADGLGSAGREGRVAWMLLYLGARQIYLLDGGWSAWLSAGGAASTQVTIQPENPEPLALQPERRMGLSQLASSLAGGRHPCLVDTRSEAEFAGQCFDYMPRKGRLPGSVLIPYASLFAPDGSFIGRDDYLSLLPAQVQAAACVVAYCEVGVRAGTFALLHEAYTGRVVPVFDGSIMEWSAYDDLPVEASSFAPAKNGPAISCSTAACAFGSTGA